MPRRSDHRNMLVEVVLEAEETTTATNTATVDTFGADAVAFHVHPSLVDAANGTLTLEESDDDVTYTAVDADDVESGDNILQTDVAIAVAYLGNKRYVQGVVTPATGCTHPGVVAVKSRLSDVPVNPTLE